MTSTAICGSDLHLYSKLWPAMKEGDILGHEPMGVVEEVGADVIRMGQANVRRWIDDILPLVSARR